MSIGTQKTMLKEYAGRSGFRNCQFYVDDGYSGTNYDRPLSGTHQADMTISSAE